MHNIGVDLEEKLNALGCEGGGGAQIHESYELFAHYMLNHCETPNADRPFLFIYGDEKFYKDVNPRQVAHYIGDVLPGPVKSEDVWKALLKKYQDFTLLFLIS